MTLLINRVNEVGIEDPRYGVIEGVWGQRGSIMGTPSGAPMGWYGHHGIPITWAIAHQPRRPWRAGPSGHGPKGGHYGDGMRAKRWPGMGSFWGWDPGGDLIKCHLMHLIGFNTSNKRHNGVIMASIRGPRWGTRWGTLYGGVMGRSGYHGIHVHGL